MFHSPFTSALVAFALSITGIAGTTVIQQSIQNPNRAQTVTATQTAKAARAQRFTTQQSFARTRFIDEIIDDSDEEDTSEPVEPSQPAAPVPNVIVSGFDYGGSSVNAGSDFNLTFTFQNMGQLAVQNMVITIDGGESFAINGGTNTFYVSALYAGASQSQTVAMQALPSAESGAQPIALSFKYEYVDQNTRNSNTSDIRISVPVSQPTRFDIADPTLPDEMTVGMEDTISVNYVNKGKGQISNVEASIEGKGLETSTPRQYVGNVASGASGSIGFAVSAQQEGEVSGTIHITYEDSDGKAQTHDIPVKLNVSAAPEVPDTNAPDIEESATTPAWVYISIAIVVLLAVVGVAIGLVFRARKRKKVAQEQDAQWQDDTFGDLDTATFAGSEADINGTAGAASTFGTQGEQEEKTAVIPTVDSTAGNIQSSAMTVDGTVPLYGSITGETAHNGGVDSIESTNAAASATTVTYPANTSK